MRSIKRARPKRHARAVAASHPPPPESVVRDFSITLVIECRCTPPGVPLLFTGNVGAGVICGHCQRHHMLRGFRYVPDERAVAWQVTTTAPTMARSQEGHASRIR